jgi:dTDP-4-amino-4,6-dideoxygalactose transaminase
MAKNKYSRREFLKQNSLTGLGAVVGMGVTPSLFAGEIRIVQTPALLGGSPVRTKEWPGWPVWDSTTDEEQVLKVLRSGSWTRAGVVTEFEKKWAETVGAKRCLAVVNGTNALIASLNQFDIGAGDEVIIGPYSFISTIICILQNGAMPVFVDTDPETFQIDADKIEAKITPNTRAILPAHTLGMPADMEKIMQIAARHNLIVVENACLSWLAEINHKKIGTFGNAGCFSFQTSKNIPIGEGGAIVSDDEKFMDRCYSYHNYGNPYGSVVLPDGVTGGTVMTGTKLRITEYQAAIGLAQLKRLESQTDKRNENAQYLKSKIQDIPGIVPFKLSNNVTKISAWQFPLRYKKESFQGLSRAEFLKALRAEGIPGSTGYVTQNDKPYLKSYFESKNYRKMYPKKMLDFTKFLEKNQCPENKLLCEEAVWFSQNMLLGSKEDMDDIVMAIEKVFKNAGELKKAGSK